MHYADGCSVFINPFEKYEQLLYNSHNYSKNASQLWHPTLGVLSDVGEYLTKVSENLNGYKCDTEWIETLRKREAARETELREVCTTMLQCVVCMTLNLSLNLFAI